MGTILLTGALGMLGRRLHPTLAERHRVVATDYLAGPGVRLLDITDEAAVRTMVKALAPDWVVNAAAYTAVDRAESEKQAAFRVNATAVGHLARAASENGARLLHFSTDFVFDGEKEDPYVESDPVGPLGAYARSKEAGEREVRETDERHLILRLSWLFGPEGKNFVDTILRAAGEGRQLRVVQDQRGTPTYTVDAARQALLALEAGLAGTVHAANQGVTTWWDLAREALRLRRLEVAVEPIATGEWPTPAPRPRNSALRNKVLEDTIGDSMRPWREALAAYLGRP